MKRRKTHIELDGQAFCSQLRPMNQAPEFAPLLDATCRVCIGRAYELSLAQGKAAAIGLRPEYHEALKVLWLSQR